MTALLTTLAATCIILNRAEQIARVRIIQNPESTPAQVQQATHDLVASNVRLAHKVAKQHVRNGLDFNDLLAQACEGIVYAAGKYEVGNKASFTTYAKQWMRARCQEHVQANAGLLHCGSRTSKKLWSSLGATIGSIIPDTALRQDIAMERTQNSESIASALESFAATLKPAHVEILRGRVIAGLTGEDQRCAKSFGVSKQRVGQIEKQLRSKLAAHFTRSFGADGVKAMLRASF
jgi:RNA polymerase sigma factor (sigma-70 family)